MPYGGSYGGREGAAAAYGGTRGGLGARGGSSGGRGAAISARSGQRNTASALSGRRGSLGDAFRTAGRWATTGGLFAGPPGALLGGAAGLAGALMGGVDFGGLGMGGPAQAGRVGPRGDRGGGNDGRTIFPGAVPGKGTVAAAIKKFTRPGQTTPPGWMRFDPVMTDLQRRSYIATEGLSGNQGLYRSDEAKSYYKNLLGNMFISPLGQPQGDLGQLLPVEQQYLQALGIPQFKDIPTLLTALGYTRG